MIFGLFLLSITLGITGCGGGGGGGGTGSGGINYTGSTTQATIDANNAKGLSTEAYSGGTVGTSLGMLGSVEKEMTDRPNYLDLTLAIKDALLRIDVHAPSGIVDAGVIKSESGTISGPCGGNAQYAIQYDDVTGNFSATISFNNFCSSGVKLTGNANFSGKVNVNTGIFLQLSLSCDNLAVTQGSTSFTAKMTIGYNFQAIPFTATMDILLRDNTTGKVSWVNNYSMKVWEGSNYIEFELSGRYYNSDYGYVNISTPTRFRIYSNDTWPSQGVMILDGRTISGGGSTKARLTIISSTQYRVEADTDGDGAYDDWDSGVLTWQ